MCSSPLCDSLVKQWEVLTTVHIEREVYSICFHHSIHLPNFIHNKINYSKDHIPKPVCLSSHYRLFHFETNTVSLIPLIILVCKGLKAMFVCYIINDWYSVLHTIWECICSLNVNVLNPLLSDVKQEVFIKRRLSVTNLSLETDVSTEWSHRHRLNAPVALMMTAAFSYFPSSSW